MPLNLLVLGGALKAKRISATVIDFNLLLRTKDQDIKGDDFFPYAIDGLERIRCKTFGITSNCANFPIAIILAREIKRKIKKSRVILGGPQPTSVAEETLNAFPEIDAIVIGEGDETLPEVLQSRFDPDKLSKIPGIAFRMDDKVVITPERPMVSNLDDLPLPDFRLINLKSYDQVQRDRGWPFLIDIEAGRGCPFSCTFCATSTVWRRKFRVKSPARILYEMDFLRKAYGFSEFGLVHDNFTYSKKYLEEFCNYLHRYNNHRHQWQISARADSINCNLLDEMSDVGCMGIFIGVESASPRMQKLIRKNLSLEDLIDTIKHCASKNISVDLSFILGFPDETPQEVEASISLAHKCKLAGGANLFFTILGPLAGTEIYKKYKDKLILGKTTSSISSCFLNSSPTIRAYVQDWPDLFSSFYFIPNEHFDDLYLEELITFYHELVDYLGETLNILFEVHKFTPLGLFNKWLAWRGRVAPNKPLSYQFVCSTFKQFLIDEAVNRPSLTA